MTGSRLAVVITVGLVGLSAPAVAGAASSDSAWTYSVTSAAGSVAWRYAGGVDSVAFQGHPRANGILRGAAKYSESNSRGCGVSHTRILSYRGPSFSVQGDYVVVTWNLPLPTQSACHGVTIATVTRQLRGSVASQKIPLSHFTCDTMSLELRGALTLAQGALRYDVTVMLNRPTPAITVSL